ncbi:MAG: cell division/cell wall cluster transcriptional repressor MraZ [Acidimicrobiales bacterium]|nr:MAG: cell division/cell wall cluster transcriptional repressor MraZ [Acidimicrobiales bacterium]
MARFYGEFEHSLDVKGRVILPVAFRPHFAAGGYLSKFDSGCLALWEPAELEKEMETLLAQAATSPELRDLARVRAAGTHEVEVDRQGRLPIPIRLREFARLDGEVLVVGAINHVELWPPVRWREHLEQPYDRRLIEA